MDIYLNNPALILQKSVDIDVDFSSLGAQIVDVVKAIIPHWINYNKDDISIQPLRGGITNILYLVSTESPTFGSSKIIFRLFGAGTAQFIDRSVENIVFSTLSQLEIGPIFYGLFLNGRIEGYLDARALSPPEMADSNVLPLVASACARLHNQNNIKISHSIISWHKVETFFDLSKSVAFENSVRKGLLGHIRAMNMDKDLAWAKDSLLATPSHYAGDLRLFKLAGYSFGTKKVFAHNDLLSGNLLLSGEDGAAEKRITIIDFEYASYNYRAWDIANYFCEFTGFEIDYVANFPSSEVRRMFLLHYIKAWSMQIAAQPTGTSDAGSVSPSGISLAGATDTVSGSSRSSKEEDEEVASAAAATVFQVDRGTAEVDSDEVAGAIMYCIDGIATGSISPVEQEAFLEGLEDCVCRFTLASHLFWGSWAIVQAGMSTIDFDFLTYAKERFEGYLYHKGLFFQARP